MLRVRDLGMLNRNWDFAIKSLPSELKESNEREVKSVRGKENGGQ